MSTFKRVLFSKVQGKITQDERPLNNITIVRNYYWHWLDRTYSQSTTTNDSGEFEFPEVKRFCFSSYILPHSALIRQEIQVNLLNNRTTLWRFNKQDYKPQTEVGGAINITCALHDDGKMLIENGIDECFKQQNTNPSVNLNQQITS